MHGDVEIIFMVKFCKFGYKLTKLVYLERGTWVAFRFGFKMMPWLFGWILGVVNAANAHQLEDDSRLLC